MPPYFVAIPPLLPFKIIIRFKEALLSIGMIFKVVITPDTEDGGYTASCPALPGCHSEGESMEEALENIKDALPY